MAFERLIFVFGGDGFRPECCRSPSIAVRWENAGMQLEERRFQNRLPLAHVSIRREKNLWRELRIDDRSRSMVEFA